jgi:formylglycine-generating enzyme required for sulfatase activity
VWVPGGEFVIGSEDGGEDERPPAPVKVAGFWMGKREVTYAQYAAFLKANPGRLEPFYWNDPRYAQANLPVIGLTWNDARAYCVWAGLRLPTEREWEYAAAGAKQLRYPTATGEMSADLAACRDDAQHKPTQLAPVGSYPPNPFGLFDLAGNAWEFTDTLYRKYPYDGADGRESTDGDDGLVVLRGGAWNFPFRHCRTSSRHYFAKHLRYDFAGMRVAASAAEIELKTPPQTATQASPTVVKK